MPASDLQISFLPGGQTHRPLGPGNGRRGFESRPQGNGHTVGDAPQDAPGVVGGRGHGTVFQDKGVVVLRATGPGGGKAVPEFQTLHRGDAEDSRRQAVFHPVKHGVPQSGGQAYGGTFHHTAHGVQGLPGRQDGCLHLLPCPVV